MFNSETKFWDALVQELPVCQELENNWEQIRDEYLVFEPKEHPFKRVTLEAPNIGLLLDKHSTGLGHERLYDGSWNVTVAGTELSESNRQWGDNARVKKIIKWKTKHEVDEHYQYAKKNFVTFNKIITKYADEGQCSGALFSMMEPGTVINPHFGSDDLMRCHLCLVNDMGAQITVGGETRNWQDGKILAFKDGRPYSHSVVHNGTHRRLVLMFDFNIDYLRAKFPDINGL